MEWITVISLLVLGLGLILLEFILIPGTTVIGFIGFAMALFGVYFGYDYFGTATGTYLLIGSTLVTGVGLYIAIKKKAWKRFSLEDEVTGKVNLTNTSLSVGDTGKTISVLRPSGEVLFGHQSVEVSTLGGFVDPNTEVKIISIDHNKIFVEPLTS